MNQLTTNPDLWLRAEWPAPSGIFAGSSLRDAGNFAETFTTDGRPTPREQLSRELALTPIHWLQQVHGVAVVQLPMQAHLPKADAAITEYDDVICAVLTADCLPVLFCAEDASVIGAAHAGWRGLQAGVLERTVSTLRQRSDAPLLAWLGPAIGSGAFEVGPEVRAAFVDTQEQAAIAFVPGRGDRWQADLYQLARQRLQRAGLSAEQIYGGGECTFSDPQRFHSYRREAVASGRMVSLIVRRRGSG